MTPFKQCRHCGEQVRRPGLQCSKCLKSKRTPEERQAERARAAERAGKPYSKGGPKSRVLHDAHVKQAKRAFSRQCEALNELMGIALDRPWIGLSDADAWRVRYAHDIEFQLRERVRRQVKKSARRDGVAELIRGALRRSGESPAAERMLGYSMGELRAHLDSLFTDGMTWDAFSQGLIHIDHIKPQAAFDMADAAQWRACWDLSNLQPLWAVDNLRKSDRLPCGQLARTASACG